MKVEISKDDAIRMWKALTRALIEQDLTITHLMSTYIDEVREEKVKEIMERR